MTRSRTHLRSAAQVFVWPLAMLVASGAGLVLGLLGTGWRDALACLLLIGGPLAVALRLAIHSQSKEP